MEMPITCKVITMTDNKESMEAFQSYKIVHIS